MSSLRSIVNENHGFRHVLETTKNEQLVAMTLKPKQDIGWEIHPQDQFFYVESGYGLAIIDRERYNLSPGTGEIIPGGARHNIFNLSANQELRLFVIYSPPKHPIDEIQEYKDEEE